MFGMSSEEFWEQDPQLYWAYRTFYLKKKEQEQKENTEYMKYTAWLNGQLTYMGVSLALNNAFSKSKKDYPAFDKVFDKTKQNDNNKKKTKKEINQVVQEQFNSWARF